MPLAYSPELSSVQTGQQTGANSIPVVVASDQTLPVSSPTLATAALQDTGNTSLSAINAKLPASLGAQTAATSLSVTPATGSTFATAANQTTGNLSLANLVAVNCTGTWAGGVADNAAVSGTIPAPGAGKTIFFKNLTFSYGAVPPSVRILTIAEGASNLVDFAITSGGAGFVSLGFAASPNTAVSFSLPASGTAGVFGRLRIYYAIVDVI
jgi:hypothetical protein